MKKPLAIISIFLFGFQILSVAQAKKQPQAKPPQPKLIRCHLPTDTDNSSKVSLQDALAWADSLPLKVVDEKGKVYQLHNFVFTIITMNPFQTKEYGTGNDGIPLLARKAMNNLKPKDTVFLKEVTAHNDKLQELPLANIVFSIKE